MNLHEVCTDCQGKGLKKCIICGCSKCGDKGVVIIQCSHCKSGKTTCRMCQGTRRVIKGRRWFADKYEVCSSCRGTGFLSCTLCNGSARIQSSCSVCGGTGHGPDCPFCRGSGRAKCDGCNGAGRFEGQWLKSLQNTPTEQLRFEYQKGQREITNLSLQIQIASQELREIESSWEEAYAHRDPDFSAGGFHEATNDRMSIIMSAEARVKEIEERLSAIDRVLNSR